MVPTKLLTWVGLLSLLLLGGTYAGRWDGPRLFARTRTALSSSTAFRTKRSSASRRRPIHPFSWKQIARGGATSSAAKNEDNDEERYSRQVYTLGARAHGLVRSATVYIDGPGSSGLTYEAAKNLALSGIGKIVIVTSQSSHDQNYHLPKWDDLGTTYVRGARAELGIDEKENDDDQDISLDEDEILVEFLHRLNPSLQVERISREEFESLQGGEGSSGILLCVDRPYDTQLELNKICRKRGFPFVAVETAGVHGRTFSDFGPTFDVHDADGETPAVVPFDRIEVVDEQDKTLLVRAVEGERHDVSKGDEIRFLMSNGEAMDTSCIVAQVKTPDRIIVRLKEDSGVDDFKTFVDEVNSMASSFTRQKQMVHVSFISLQEATEQATEDPSLFTPCDFDKAFDETRKMAVFHSFQALNAFVKTRHKLPTGDDVAEFLGSINEVAVPIEKDQKWTQHCQLFATKCAAKFVPIQAIFGAIAAQECLKAASGLYNPIRQFLLYDCDEIVAAGEDVSEPLMEESIDSGLTYIVGSEISKELRSRKLFVVGAGAIGCEILKNLAAMGAGTNKKGVIVVTDMDTIERSNLSRQLLFRDSDISKFKSKAAEEAIARLNPLVKIESHTNKVGGSELGPFDSTFWSKKVHVVLNALDNVDARLYMDGQCVANQKALVDAGTLGSKGNVQVVVPHQSESYASSADPPDQAIPVCTLKNFPYAISHTIQWGRDLFDGLFARRPKQANQYAEVLASRNIQELKASLEQDLGGEAAEDMARELAEDLSMVSGPMEESVVRGIAISWAVDLVRRLFHDSIVKLLEEHPLDSLDDDGEPFWSGSRRPPTPVKFQGGSTGTAEGEVGNENLIDFIRYAARLRIETFLGESSSSLISCEEARTALLAAKGGETQEDSADEMLELLEPLQDFKGSNIDLKIAEFEKDDEANGHVAFITAASNLRAMCYGIAPVDSMETRRVAGRIVPAMITTTAFVSALSCIELLKLVQKSPLKRYRNAFINLALPFFAFTVPLPAEEVDGVRGQKYTLWDRITIKETKKAASDGGMTLRHLLKRVKKKSCDEHHDSIEIASISFGQYMIYANFLNEDDDELLDKNLWEVVQEAIASGDEFDSSFSRDANLNGASQIVDVHALDLTVIVEDTETGEEVELPPVKVLRSTQG